MKKLYGLLLAVITVCVLSACGEKEQENKDVIQIYGISTTETKVEAHPHEMTAKQPGERLDELILCMETSPEKLEYKVPLAMGFRVLDVNWEDNKVQLNVDAAYLNMPVTTEVLVRAAIVRTLTQLDGVSYVGITVEGNQLFDSTGSPVSWMNADQFIDNDGN